MNALVLLIAAGLASADGSAEGEPVGAQRLLSSPSPSQGEGGGEGGIPTPTEAPPLFDCAGTAVAVSPHPAPDRDERDQGSTLSRHAGEGDLSGTSAPTNSDSDSWLDRSHAAVSQGLLDAIGWFDDFFADEGHLEF